MRGFKFFILLFTVLNVTLAEEESEEETTEEPCSLIPLYNFESELPIEFWLTCDYFTWDEALTYCVEEGLHLAAITPVSAAFKVRTLFRQTEEFGHFWISASYFKSGDVPARWFWYTPPNTAVADNIPFWLDNKKPTPQPGLSLFLNHTATDHTWHAEQKDERKRAICQIDYNNIPSEYQ